MNNTYDIFLLDGENQIKLDSEEVDMSITFSVADISDISVRKDAITKTVNFSGTKTNNMAFGSLFSINKIFDSSLDSRIGFNYNPIQTVDCYVYEGGIVLFKGTMRVIQIDVNKMGDINYQTVITGSLIDFRSIIQDKLLTDLDFSDLTHNYSYSNIVNSWGAGTQRTNLITKTFYNVPFKKGSGYVYPFIDYGVKFTPRDNDLVYNTINQVPNKINILNLRPAIYVKEYLDRIFQQLENYSYEIKGSDDFKEKFDSLIIPDSQEKFVNTYNDFFLIAKNNTVQNQTGSQLVSATGYKSLLIKSLEITNNSGNYIPPFVEDVSSGVTKLTMKRDVNGLNTSLNVHFDSIKNPYNSPVAVWVQIVKNDTIVLGQTKPTIPATLQATIYLNPLEEKTNFDIEEIVTGDFDIKTGETISARLFWSGSVTNCQIIFSISDVELRLPKSDTFQITVAVNYGDGSNVDIVQPKTSDMKQVDFVKSLINLFNLYAYPELHNEKHLIFQKYDDFYAKASPQNILGNANNWTEKIDYSSGYSIISNLSIPKAYTFTYKDDSDFLNDDYKQKYNEVYGTKSITDSSGIIDEKKIELSFSATPMAVYSGTDRMIAALYQGSLTDKKTSKTNDRILFFNGLIPCGTYDIFSDNLVNGLWTATGLGVGSLSQYANASTYYIKEGKVIEDLNFARPKLWNFITTINYVNAPGAFENYYENQLEELTNPNIFTIKGYAFLNEFDINSLDLTTPIFIDMGNAGQAYFKVLSVEYQNNFTPSKIVLQKIFLGTEK